MKVVGEIATHKYKWNVYMAATISKARHSPAARDETG